MKLPIRIIRAQLPDHYNQGRSVTVELRMDGRSLAFAVNDSMGTYSRDFSLPVIETTSDDLGPVAYLTEGTIQLGFEWEVVVEPEFDLPFTEDEQPMWVGTNINLRSIKITDKFNMEELVRKQLNVPEPFPVGAIGNIIVPISHDLTLHFRANGTFESGSYSIITKEFPS